MSAGERNSQEATRWTGQDKVAGACHTRRSSFLSLSLRTEAERVPEASGKEMSMQFGSTMHLFFRGQMKFAALPLCMPSERRFHCTHEALPMRTALRIGTAWSRLETISAPAQLSSARKRPSVHFARSENSTELHFTQPSHSLVPDIAPRWTEPGSQWLGYSIEERMLAALESLSPYPAFTSWSSSASASLVHKRESSHRPTRRPT